MEKLQELFSSSDLDLVAYLLTQGFKFVQSPTLPAAHSRVHFHFQKSEKIEKAVMDFINRRASVEPVAFAESLRSIKTQAQELRGRSRYGN